MKTDYEDEIKADKEVIEGLKQKSEDINTTAKESA